jgi:hypothetical protein
VGARSVEDDDALARDVFGAHLDEVNRN